MTVAELIAELEKLDSDAVVWVRAERELGRRNGSRFVGGPANQVFTGPMIRFVVIEATK
jgi:hypothetical protein